jgi:hypothetical protein
MTHLDDNLLTALEAARPDTGDQPSADSPEATAMLTRILETPRRPANRPDPQGPAVQPDPQRPAKRPRPTVRKLIGTVVVPVAGFAAAVVVAVTVPGAPAHPGGSNGLTPASVRTAVLDAIQKDTGDIMYATQTAKGGKAQVITEQGWVYPAFAVPGQQVKFRLFTRLNGVPVDDAESIYIQDVAATRLSLKTTQGPHSSQITDVKYASKTWSRQRSSSVLLGMTMSPALIRSQIASGHFTVTGTGWVRGHRAVELTWRSRHGLVRNTSTLWVDAKTFQPLLGSSTMQVVTGNREQTIHTDTTQYQILAATPANLHLLTPPIPPGFTRVPGSPNS